MSSNVYGDIVQRSNILTNIFYTIINKKDYIYALNQLRNVQVYGTTMTSYRKIHSLITDIVDKVLSFEQTEQVTSTASEKVSMIISELVRVSLLVLYQMRRGLINRTVADGLHNILNTITSTLQNYLRSKDLKYIELAKKQVDALKIIIDGILAFHYEKFKK